MLGLKAQLQVYLMEVVCLLSVGLRDMRELLGPKEVKR